ncbi:hypothetical protein [Rhodomicrobium sp.]|uniref:hypothetical protein n=1 Tax=Rhodomicrobium sp. TaxID=2720632 RepID=UPI0039E2B861
MSERRHVLVAPADPDWTRSDRQIDGIWFHHPGTAVLLNRIPAALDLIETGWDFTFSSHRSTLAGDPAVWPIAEGVVPITYVLAPLTPIHGENVWAVVVYSSSDREPVQLGEKFSSQAGCLRRRVETFFTGGLYDRLRRQRWAVHEEIWVRHDLRADELAPNAFPLSVSQQADLARLEDERSGNDVPKHAAEPDNGYLDYKAASELGRDRTQKAAAAREFNRRSARAHGARVLREIMEQAKAQR